MAAPARILVIDDEPGALKVTSAILRKDGHDVDVSLDALEALGKMEGAAYDCVLVDFKMPEMDGLEFITVARERGHTVPIVMVTAFGTVKMAVETMKRGAYNYLTKPLNFDEVRLLVQQAIEKSRNERDLERLRAEVSEKFATGNIIARSRRMHEVLRMLEMVADTDASVLILGETGTGKCLVARAIHYHSRRRANAFVHVNCAALPETLLESELFGHEKGAFTGAIRSREGRFEKADGGTLFLDEIGNLPLELQAKLLRVLQESEFERVGGEKTLRVDVRILAATNVRLEEAVARHEFREDLYYRLNVVPIRIPPLRDRSEDIPLLAQHFLATFADRSGKRFDSIAPDVMSRMLAYVWPGNVRQLENLMERAVVLSAGPSLSAVDLPEPAPTPAPAPPTLEFDLPLKRLQQKMLEKLERDYIEEMLRRYHGNVGLASRQSGITRRSLYEKMKLYGLRKENFKRLG